MPVRLELINSTLNKEVVQNKEMEYTNIRVARDR